MKRQGIYRPTVEDLIEISGIETLHPGGMQLTLRTAEVTGMKSGLKVLDVSCGRGTQAVYYAKHFGIHVTGLDLSEEMLVSAISLSKNEGVGNLTDFIEGDSQNLPFDSDSFDIVINECAVGIPDDSQAVVDEMLRVCKPDGRVAIHESTWNKSIAPDEKSELSERYGTTPLQREEWIAMLQKAGTINIESELEPWSQPEMFWRSIRKDRIPKSPFWVMSLSEKLITIGRAVSEYGLSAIPTALKNESQFMKAVQSGVIGYGLYWGSKQ